MDASIKPLSSKVSMFASNKEIYNQLTSKEISLIKLGKLEEYIEDLYSAIQNPQTSNLFPPQDSYNKIMDLLKELRKLNKNKLNNE